MRMGVVVWLIILAVMLVFEIISLGLTTIWFCVGAIGAAIAAALGFGIWVQILACFVLSVAAMALFRPIAMKFINKEKEKTNIDEVIGKAAVVTKKIDNEMSLGEVRLNGVEWTARSGDGRVIPAGERVTVASVEGVKLIVK